MDEKKIGRSNVNRSPCVKCTMWRWSPRIEVRSVLAVFFYRDDFDKKQAFDLLEGATQRLAHRAADQEWQNIIAG